MGLLKLLFLPVFAFAFYMLPTCVAMLRGKQNLLPIALVNFFLGGSIIGWVLTLVWALTADPPRPIYHTPVNVYVPNAGGFCPACGKFNQADGRFCPSCGQSMGRQAEALTR